MTAVVDLYMTDFCPFAERAWLAFLEKEQDPTHPTLFNYIEVNYFNPQLPLTQEFLKLHNTVPAGRCGEEELRESLPIAYWVDAHYPNNPLQPTSDAGKELMKQLIEKYSAGKYNIISAFYNLLFTTKDDATYETQKTNLLAAYAELSSDLTASGGPYLLGDQFSIGDIALIPFVDRAVVLLDHYKGITIPRTPEYAALHDWRVAYQARPSHRVADADRLPRSVAVQPFAATKRNEYIIEMYAMYAHNCRETARPQLLGAPAGVATINIEKALAEKAQKIQVEKQAVRTNRIIQAAIAGTIIMLAAAKLVQFLSKRKANNKQ